MRPALLVPVLLALACERSVPAPGTLPPFAVPAEQADVFRRAETWTLLTTDLPRPDEWERSGPDAFHGARVLGRAELGGTGERVELVRALNRGIARSDGSMAACWGPRHGLRAEGGGERADLLICFECLQVRVYDGAGTCVDTVLTTEEPAATFDRVFEAQGLRIAGRPR